MRWIVVLMLLAMIVATSAQAARPKMVRMHPIREYHVPGGHTYLPDPGPTAY